MRRRKTILSYYYYYCWIFSVTTTAFPTQHAILRSGSACSHPNKKDELRSSNYSIRRRNGILFETKSIYIGGSVNNVNITTSNLDHDDDVWSRMETTRINGTDHPKREKEKNKEESLRLNTGVAIVNNHNNGSSRRMENSVLEKGFDVKNGSSSSTSFSKKQAKASLKQLWQRRHARSINEGIRRTKDDLNQILNESGFLSNGEESIYSVGKSKSQYVARTLTGLIMAFAEEVEGLQVEVESRVETPVWDKHVNKVRIKFRRLGFKPLRMGGFNNSLKGYDDNYILPEDEAIDNLTSDVDEAFQRIDVDNSGSLDQGELATALGMAMGGEENSITNRRVIPKAVLASLAARLVALYDTNGDKQLDREEYRSMVEDMAALRKAQRIRKLRQSQNSTRNKGLAKTIWRGLLDVITFQRWNGSDHVRNSDQEVLFDEISTTVTGHESSKEIIKSSTGSITFSNLKLDLRQLLFGSVPGVKYVTPGGPLVLEPFTLTFKGSFDRNDFMNSFLLDSGLRRLVARALRLRVRSIRDLLDGAMFYGRQWNMASAEAPMVEVPQLTNIEFDKQDRLIITGIAQIRASPDAPTIENSFKLRTRIGTRMNGQVIRLQDPEIAILLECPKAWERNIVSIYKKLNQKVPIRPEPITIFTPLIQPRKFQNKDGYDMGEDNNIRSIKIKDGALRIEMSVVIRPGRFLGSHYVAFSVPQRTFIVTKDRVTNGLRQARKNKLTAEEFRDANSEVELISDLDHRFSFAEPKRKERSKSFDDGESSQGNFIGKFLRGYSSAKIGEKEMEEWVISNYLKTSISDWFGRQSDSLQLSSRNSTDVKSNELTGMEIILEDESMQID